MDGIVLQVPVIGMAWGEFTLLFITALAGGAFGALPAFVVFFGGGRRDSRTGDRRPDRCGPSNVDSLQGRRSGTFFGWLKPSLTETRASHGH